MPSEKKHFFREIMEIMSGKGWKYLKMPVKSADKSSLTDVIPVIFCGEI
jgi:hypothetical protein